MSGIVLVTPRQPENRGAWSGSSHHLLTALAKQGRLATAVDGHVAPIRAVEMAATYSRSSSRWQQRRTTSLSRVAVVTRPLTNQIVRRRLRRLRVEHGAIVQIGGRLRLARERPSRGIYCSYQDGNLAAFLRRPDLSFSRTSRTARRMLEMERRTCDELDLIMCFSDWLRETFIADLRQDPTKVVTIGAGANLALAPDPPPDRGSLPPRFLFIGRLWDQKGGPELVGAFQELRAQRPTAELWIVSDGGPESAIPGVRHFGRIDRQTRRGDERIRALYRDATAFVMPAKYEPFGIAFLEAMAHGLPCLGTATCAMPEIIANNVTGFLVTPGDNEELLQRLDALADPVLCRQFGDAGYRRFIERFTWDAVVRRMAAEIDRRIGV